MANEEAIASWIAQPLKAWSGAAFSATAAVATAAVATAAMATAAMATATAWLQIFLVITYFISSFMIDLFIGPPPPDFLAEYFFL